MYLETSAKSGENVEESFLKCCKTILAKIQTGNFIVHLSYSSHTPSSFFEVLFPKFFVQTKTQNSLDARLPTNISWSTCLAAYIFNTNRKVTDEDFIHSFQIESFQLSWL